jgi:hypothetical protein
MVRVLVGMKCRFDPMAHLDGMLADTLKGEEVEGTVVMVNRKHGWFSVEYGNPKARTSFNFVDIFAGEVTILG